MHTKHTYNTCLDRNILTPVCPECSEKNSSCDLNIFICSSCSTKKSSSSSSSLALDGLVSVCSRQVHLPVSEKNATSDTVTTPI